MSSSRAVTARTHVVAARTSFRCEFSHVHRQRQLQLQRQQKRQGQARIQPFRSICSVRNLSSSATSSFSFTPATKSFDSPRTPTTPTTPTTPQPPPSLNPTELSIFNKLRAHFMPSKLSVEDISGGCGSMYALEIESSQFKGQSLVKQQRMVNEVLKEDMEKNNWHGVRIKTGVGR